MTDISACGRIVFHIPWCPDCLSLIRKKNNNEKKKFDHVFATSFSRLFLIYLRVMAKNKNFRKFPCKRVSNQNWFFRNASFSDHPAPPRLHPGLYARSNIPQANKPNATWGPFLESPGNLSGPISRPVSPRKLFGCFSKLPLFTIPVNFPVTCPVTYGRS